MNFCPSCGEGLQPGQNFCRGCGYNLQARYGPQPLQQGLSPSFPIYGMDTKDVYLIDDDGLVRVWSLARLVVLPVLFAVGLAELISTFFASISPTTLGIALVLVIAPIFGEYRNRRLSRLFSLPRWELLLRKGAVSTPWSNINQMTVKGRTLSFTTAKRWTTIRLDKSDIPPLSGKASAMLGPRFVVIPDNTRLRLSPQRKFLLLTLALFALGQVILVWASVSPFFTGEQEHYSTIYSSMQQSLRTASIVQQFGAIFFNNVQVASIGLIPGIGPLELSVASYNTGRVIQVIATQNTVSPSYLLFVLFALPHSWIEELSYPLAEALGLYAVLEWRRQSYTEFSNWRTRASTKISLGFVIIALVLATAALLEVTEPHLGYAGLLLWGPVLIGGAYAYIRFKSRIAAALS